MPTRARTKNPPLNLATLKDAPTIPVLTFNQEGKIDVILLNDTNALAVKFGLQQESRVNLDELAMTNILFQVAQRGLPGQTTPYMPGESTAQDERLFDSIKSLLSENITNPGEVAEDIRQAWNHFGKHPYLKTYSDFKTNAESSKHLIFQGAYELTLHEYMVHYLSTLTHFDAIETWVFLTASELVLSTLEGRPYFANPYIQMHALNEVKEKCTRDLAQQAGIIDRIDKRLKREENPWYTDLVGHIGNEFEFTLDEDLQKKPACLQHILLQLLHGNFNVKIDDPAVAKNLADLLDLLRAPHETPLFRDHLQKKGNPHPWQVCQTVQACIYKAMKEQNFIFILPANNMLADLLCLAHSPLTEDNEKAVSLFFEKSNRLTPAELHTLSTYCRPGNMLRDIANSLIQEKLTQEVPALPAAAPAPLAIAYERAQADQREDERKRVVPSSYSSSDSKKSRPSQ